MMIVTVAVVIIIIMIICGEVANEPEQQQLEFMMPTRSSNDVRKQQRRLINSHSLCLWSIQKAYEKYQRIFCRLSLII